MDDEVKKFKLYLAIIKNNKTVKKLENLIKEHREKIKESDEASIALEKQKDILEAYLQESRN